MENQNNKAKKFDSGKPRYDLLPAEALEEVVKVLTMGAEKYGDRNWENGLDYGRCFAAAQRHMWAWWNRQDLDPESGLTHLAHACVNLMFLMAFEKRGKVCRKI